MTDEHLSTQEEKAFEHLFEANRQVLSEAALTIFGKAYETAYTHNLISNYNFSPQEYPEAMSKMRLAAAELTEHDREILAEIVRASRAAAASIDPEDKRLAGYNVYRGYAHY